MNHRKTFLALLSVIVLIGSSQISAAYFRPKDLPNARDIEGSGLSNVPPVEVAIASLQNRIKQSPSDGITYALLANQYIRQARETGDVTGYQRAETALKESLALIPNYSLAKTSLASVYYAQHNFAHALALAEKEYEANPRNTQALVLIGDAQLSLGNYQEAETIYRQLSDTDATPPVLARLASLEELNGRPEEALALMRRAAGDALRAGGTREGIAWYILRVGDMYYNMGQYKKAGNYYEAALRIQDNYYLALAGMGKVRAAQGDYDQAIDYFQQVVNIVPQPEYLTALGDLYAMTGQPEQMQQQYKTVEFIGKLAKINRQVYNRQLANFYSDHNFKLDEALELALAELEVRRDIYGYDAAAWASYKNGNYEEAQVFMDRALALGTRDASLHYHAGMIALGLGNEIKAREYLEQALAINPHFSILYAEEARRTLQGLQ